jgi:hypothetical protein
MRVNPPLPLRLLGLELLQVLAYRKRSREQEKERERVFEREVQAAAAAGFPSESCKCEEEEGGGEGSCERRWCMCFLSWWSALVGCWSRGVWPCVAVCVGVLGCKGEDECACWQGKCLPNSLLVLVGCWFGPPCLAAALAALSALARSGRSGAVLSFFGWINSWSAAPAPKTRLAPLGTCEAVDPVVGMVASIICTIPGIGLQCVWKG